MKIAIFGRTIPEKVQDAIQRLFQTLKAQETDILIFKSFKGFLSDKIPEVASLETFKTPDEIAGCDYVFSIGGDGTLLETVTYIGDKGIPVLAINAGRLGFLANIPSEKIAEALDALVNGEYKIDERILLHLEDDGSNLFDGINYALNEFAILKTDTSSMIVVHTYLNGDFLNSYWSDGLIVSTPTGSTGYSLSCGGPLVMPQTHNFIIAPVNPHNLNVRPIVVSDDSELTFKIEGRSNKFLVSLDSRSKAVDPTIELKIRKENFKVRLIQLPESNFFNTLRAKLNWGLDIRN